jgi:hypothetical protein
MQHLISCTTGPNRLRARGVPDSAENGYRYAVICHRAFLTLAASNSGVCGRGRWNKHERKAGHATSLRLAIPASPEEV